MAGDWIKVELVTIDKPEVLLMADLLEKSPDEVFGMLFRVWRWFDQSSRDGNAGGVTGVTLMKFVDRLVNRPGFAACMKKVGWLTESGVPNFERHNGESAKKRALTKERAQRFRNANSNANVTQIALPEKRREEKKEHTQHCAVSTAPDGFSRFWDVWPKSSRKVAKSACLKKWQSLGLEKISAEIAASVESLKTTKQWRDGFEPAPLTFINQRRWEDEGPETAADNPIYADMGLR